MDYETYGWDFDGDIWSAWDDHEDDRDIAYQALMTSKASSIKSRLAARRSNMTALQGQTEEILSLMVGCACDIAFEKEIEDLVDMMIYFASKCRQMSYVDLKGLNERWGQRCDEGLKYIIKRSGSTATFWKVWIQFP